MTVPGILDLVSRAEGGPYYTTKQVADLVGRSPDTIRRWARIQRPSHKMELGDHSFVWLYTEQDVSRLQKFASEQKPGRKKKI